jgi:hypothetical protein
MVIAEKEALIKKSQYARFFNNTLG